MNEAEFREFVAGTKSIVLAAIRRNLNPALGHAIDDVAQESYLRAYRFLKKRGASALEAEKSKSWIYTIARNESRRMNESHGREQRRIQLAADNLPQTIDAPDDSGALPTGLSQITDDAAAAQIESLAGDDAQLRAILKMKAGGYRVREIAAGLNIPEGTIKSRLFRLRVRLRKAMNMGGSQ